MIAEKQRRGPGALEQLPGEAVALLGAEHVGRFHLQAAPVPKLPADSLVKAHAPIHGAGHGAVPLNDADAAVAVPSEALAGQKSRLVAVVPHKIGLVILLAVLIRGDLPPHHHIGDIELAQDGGILPARTGGPQNDAVRPLGHGVFYELPLPFRVFPGVADHGQKVVCNNHILQALAGAGEVDVAELGDEQENQTPPVYPQAGGHGALGIMQLLRRIQHPVPKLQADQPVGVPAQHIGHRRCGCVGQPGHIFDCGVLSPPFAHVNTPLLPGNRFRTTLILLIW